MIYFFLFDVVNVDVIRFVIVAAAGGRRTWGPIAVGIFGIFAAWMLRHSFRFAEFGPTVLKPDLETENFWVFFKLLA